ncbi:phage tail tape measure protein, partial [Acinetobacter baumannii]|nr:phage tail tape measure protein [Acinetobacter baumannii]
NIQLAKNQVAGLAINIGNVLLPPINTMLGKFTAVMTVVQDWASRNPALASTLVKIAVGGIAIIGVISALSLGVLALLGPLAMLKMTFSTLG